LSTLIKRVRVTTSDQIYTVEYYSKDRIRVLKDARNRGQLTLRTVYEGDEITLGVGTPLWLWKNGMVILKTKEVNQIGEM